MFIEFLTNLKDSISFFNLFEYITFRSGLSAIIALLISFTIGPWVIHILQKNQIGEEIRLNAPNSHMKKRHAYNGRSNYYNSGTPPYPFFQICLTLHSNDFIFNYLDGAYRFFR